MIEAVGPGVSRVAVGDHVVCSFIPAAGQLKLDELITRRYRLDEINQGYQDLEDGKIIRGVILHTD